MSFREPPERLCPGCGASVPDDTTRCGHCGYGLRPELDTSRPATRHRTLFDRDEPSPVVRRLAREFRCPHCRSFGATITTLGRLVELRTIGTTAVANCRHCGAQQLFNLEAFESSPGVRWDILDAD